MTTASVTLSGKWEFTVTVVLGQHAFTVREELGGVDSPAWVVIVGEAVVTPEITLVTDSNGEVAHNGTTLDTTVTLNGTAKANEAVELFQDGTLLGDVPVNANSVWTRSVTGLTVSSHDFQARARYGNNPVSNVRSLTVLASAAPTISSIKDSAGVEIPPDTTTFSTSVTLTGTAAAGQQVQIFDGVSSLGTVTAAGTIWALPLTGLALKAYSIRARALYGSNPESAVRGFTVAVATAPTISSIKDAAGVEVPAGGTTYSTSVTLTGTAVAAQQVQIFDGTTSLGTVVATGGNWTLAVSSLTAKAYSVRARGLYGSNPESAVRGFTVAVATAPTTAKAYSVRARGLYGSNPESAVRGFTVAVATAPTISSIKDAAGVEVPAGGTTYSTSVTLTGTAAAGQQVQIFDGTTSLGTVVATGGNWTLAVSSLTAKAYSVRARGLYGSNPESAVRGFTVAVATAPTISSIKDAAGVEVPAGGTTYSASVTLTGTAAAGQQVQIFDGANSLGTVPATGVNWTLVVSSLTAKAYSVRAVGLYGSNPESAVRGFTVAVATAPTISSIKDAAGIEVPAGGTTYSTSVTLTGTAAAGQQVQVFDGANSLGTVPATGVNWTLVVSSLTAKAYSVRAVGLYGSNPESAVRGFTVALATAPTISSIKDAAGIEVPAGGTTYSTSVTLTGTAAAGQQVQVFDGANSLGTVVAYRG
ncbi:hypothetical protein NLO98_07725 [Pseudomonas syringae]|nr:hypothetical protein [Pseudomonas syringae]